MNLPLVDSLGLNSLSTLPGHIHPESERQLTCYSVIRLCNPKS